MMRNVRRRLLTAVIAGGLLVSSGAAANAAGTTAGSDGLPPVTQVTAANTISTDLAPAQGTHAATSARDAVPAVASASAPETLATTGVNTGLLVVGLLFLVFGGLLALILGRKRG
ncbi:hypothetical protein J7I84_00370 [Arthrobacter sp. ISL-85]|uniref:hypothetical protein n=1 Tax=Arthrobacter sp. ISL-85 TaxID=2819115 RepID=UPI001BE84374|nr:hypothetical protein [Arthrobacter sp. ISL-85]MBT2564963.1 hypothetical protein [Arthrobacter sp. ISL-85]